MNIKVQNGRRTNAKLNCRLERHLTNGKVVVVVRRGLRAFSYSCRACASARVDHYHIRIEYMPGVVNEGDYYTKKDMLSALKTFTSVDELEFVQRYWKNEK